MYETPLDYLIFDKVTSYVDSLAEVDQEKLFGHLSFLCRGKHELVYTKQLSGQIRELIVKQHRIIYFEKEQTIYFVDGFKKQSSKTPKRVINRAIDIYNNT